jgi:hypothetical protein
LDVIAVVGGERCERERERERGGEREGEREREKGKVRYCVRPQAIARDISSSRQSA